MDVQVEGMEVEKLFTKCRGGKPDPKLQWPHKFITRIRCFLPAPFYFISAPPYFTFCEKNNLS